MAYRRLPEVLARHAGSVKVLHTLRPFAVAMFLRNWSKLGECASISFCSTLAAVQVWISGNDRPQIGP